jgi:hypothetical protein
MSYPVIFNAVLIFHFAAFLCYAFKLVLLFPRQERRTDKSGLLLGIILLLTGILLVALKYPAVNYYKVVPKLSIFLIVTAISATYSSNPLPKSAYYLLLSLTLLASVIAVIKV